MIFKMSSAFVFIALIGILFINGSPIGNHKIELSQNEINEILLTPSFSFSTGLAKAVNYLNNDNLSYRQVIKKILGASYKFASGIFFEVKVAVVESKCFNTIANTNTFTTKDCPAKAGSEENLCQVTIFDARNGTTVNTTC
nr:uncharacterized protein LOC100210101 [Hydra vulgaris]